MTDDRDARKIIRSAMPPDAQIADSLEQLVDKMTELIEAIGGIDERLRDIEGTIALLQPDT